MFESIKYLKKEYPETSLKIVLIPHAINIYKWEYPVIIKNSYLNRQKKLIDSEELKKWDLISNEIETFSFNQKIKYINLENTLSKIGKKEYIHGLRDPHHFSIKGYEYISKVLNAN